MQSTFQKRMIPPIMKLSSFFNSLRSLRGADKSSNKVIKTQGNLRAVVNPYHAVSVKPGLLCCTQATKLRQRRFLSRAAPALPLPGCNMPKECSCCFLKHADRRQGDRRLFGAQRDVRFYSGTERRRKTGRRSTDAAYF
jgi:hypothetical protein